METGRAIYPVTELQSSARLRVVAPQNGACATCTVRNRVICGALGPAERDDLARIGRVQAVPRGSTLLWEGEEARLVANVLEGVLKLSTSTADGREQILGVAYVSDFVGRPFSHTSPYRITALTDARVCIFPRAAFDRFAREHQALEHLLLERTLSELDRAHAQLLDLGRRTATERVASFLLDLSQRLADAGCGAHAGPQPPLDRFDLPLDRQQIGDLMGLAIETVSRTVQKLRAAKILDLPGRRTVHILDRRRLEAAAGL
jgi:CRP/FNR family transcriptional regulator